MIPYRERKCADIIGTVLVPISNPKILIHFFQIKCTEAILSDCTRKLLRFEISRMLIAVFKNKFIVSFITISGTISTKKLCAWLLFHYRLSTNIPTISIMSPIQAASEAMIASAVAETREKQQSRLFRTLERKFVKRFSRKTVFSTCETTVAKTVENRT